MFTPGQKPKAPAVQQASPLLRIEPQLSKTSQENSDIVNPLKSHESDSGGGLPREVSAFELEDEVENVKQEVPLELKAKAD